MNRWKTPFIIEETDAACSTNNRSVLIADHRYTESSPFWLQYLFLLHSAGRFFDVAEIRYNHGILHHVPRACYFDFINFISIRFNYMSII